MNIFRRNRGLLISCGFIVLISGLCMAEVTESNLQDMKTGQESQQGIISEDAIFVSATGSDSSGSGEMEKPYATISKALKMVQPGQTVYIRGGIYKEGITINKSGREGAYIKICSYPGEEVILDYSSSSDEIMINLGGQSYIHIEGLELRNNKHKWAYGFYLANGEDHIIIRNNKIHDIYATKPTSSNSGANAIICYGERADKAVSHILIEGNEVYDCNTGWCEAISVTGNCEYVSVINNTVRNTGNIGIDFCGNFGYCEEPSLDQPRYCIARGNVISKANSPNATSYGLYADGARDILFESNIIYDSQGGIEIGAEEASDYPTQNITVRNNLVYNNSENGITVGGYYTGGGKARNIKIYNNTVVNNGEENGELVISVVDGLEVVNNIFYTEADKALVSSEFSAKYTKNLSFGHNVYYSSKEADKAVFKMNGKIMTGFESWKQSYDAAGLFGKPSFKDISGSEYELTEGSVGIEAGDNRIDAGKLDLNGHERYQGIIDCGAYEYGTGESKEDQETIVPAIPEGAAPEEEKNDETADRNPDEAEADKGDVDAGSDKDSNIEGSGRDKDSNIEGAGSEEDGNIEGLGSEEDGNIEGLGSDEDGNIEETDKDDTNAENGGNAENKEEETNQSENDKDDASLEDDKEDNTEIIEEKITVLNEINEIQVGNKHFLKVALDTNYENQTLSFATSDRSIAKISANGNIKAVSQGEVEITITSAYGTTYVMPLKVVI